MVKLASLEKIMATLQNNMSCMKEDVGVVHKEMVKIGEHLSLTRNNAHDVADAQERGPLEATTWCTWTREGNVTTYVDAETRNNYKGEKNPCTAGRGKPHACRARCSYLHPASTASRHGGGDTHKHWKLGG